MAVAVLVLQAFAVQRRAAGGATDQEAAGAHVAGSPGEVAGALEAKHRVVDIERDHRLVRHRVRGGGGDPSGHGARFVDAFLEHLPVLVLLVVHQLLGILRTIELADLGEDAELPEHALHAEGAALVGDDRHDALSEAFVAHQLGQHLHEGHRGRDLALARGFELRLEFRQWRHGELRVTLHPALRERPPQRLAPLAHIFHFLRVLGEADEGHPLQLFVVIGMLKRSRKPRRACSPIFLAWWAII